ncbi:hypothetical protein [Nocardia sp. BMG51109]|uniref:nSTAND1 domain-containing NTPase n=1 Tax=Nocardia sp. BMG51109 TaxID=1056816 RepID=UPI000466379B|nr:hypothetical protein [Nocardia sp. BMG51109]
MTGNDRDTEVTGAEDESGTGSDRDRHVDARAAQGVQVGDHNTQVIYSYRGTWTDGVAPAPLIGVTGEVESPYRGLGWFSERDAPFFFGRDKAIDEVLQRLSQRLHQPGVLVVSGVSGAGKSSLLRAGVIPRLRGVGLDGAAQAHRWACLLLTAGHSPLDELAVVTAQVAGLDAATIRRELRDDPAGFAVTAAQAARQSAESGEPGGLLLVVDQFEQVFTQCSDEIQRQAFVTALDAAATIRHADTTVLVVLVMRNDFEARCGDYEQLIDAIQHHFLVTAMTERQLRLAIAEPAKQAGSRVDDDLTEQLLRETRVRAVDSEPVAATMSAAGVLPLLSYALDRTWRLRSGDTVTVADYERSGGLEGAVADSAQRAYDSLTRPQRQAARRIFTRLVVNGSDGADTADRVHRDDLAWDGVNPADIDAVLAAFTAERLLTMGKHTVEISHEVLLTTWPLLRDTWLAETRENRAVCARLRAAAAEWDRNSRDSAHLYSGNVLNTAVTAADQVAADPARYPPLGATETRFLAAGIRARHLRVRQRRAATGVLMFLVVALAAATLVAFHASRKSDEQRDRAVARELVGKSERLASSDPLGSRVSALAAWRIDPTPEARNAVLAAIRNPAMTRFTPIPTGQLTTMAMSPDRNVLATGGSDGVVRLWDIARNQPVGELPAGKKLLSALEFSPDGRTLAIGGDSEDRTVQLWDVERKQPFDEPAIRLDWGVQSVAFGSDGKSLAASSWKGKIQRWDIERKQPLPGLSVIHLGDDGAKVTFSPDGKTVVSGGFDGTVQLWDMGLNEPLGERLANNKGPVQSMAFSPDGKTLAIGGDDGTIRLWDAIRREPLGEPLTGHNKQVLSVAFSPDGKTLTTGGADGTIRLWDVEHNRALGEPLTGHDGMVNSITFSTDGKTLATGGADNTVRLWNVAIRRPLDEQLTGHNEKTGVSALALSPDGKTLATGGSDGTVRFWDVERNKLLGQPLLGHTLEVASVAFSPDGKTLATGGFNDSTVQLWNVEDHRPLGNRLSGSSSAALISIVFSPDGKTLATGAQDGTVRLWRVEDYQFLDEPMTGHKNYTPLRAVAFSPNGKNLAAGGGQSTRLWDMKNHRPLGKPLEGRNPPTSFVAFSPDSKTLAISSLNTGTVQLWSISDDAVGDKSTISHGEPVQSMIFSPDNKTIATGDRHGTVRLWDVENNRPLGEPLNGPGGSVQSMVFSPDGRILVEATDNAEVRLWDLGFTTDPAVSLCASTPAWFTREQWNNYAPPEPPYRNLCP